MLCVCNARCSREAPEGVSSHVLHVPVLKKCRLVIDVPPKCGVPTGLLPLCGLTPELSRAALRRRQSLYDGGIAAGAKRYRPERIVSPTAWKNAPDNFISTLGFSGGRLR